MYQQAEKNSALSAETTKAKEQQRQLAVRIRELEKDYRKLDIQISNAKGWALHYQGGLIDIQHFQRPRAEQVEEPVDEEVDVLGTPPIGN